MHLAGFALIRCALMRFLCTRMFTNCISQLCQGYYCRPLKMVSHHGPQCFCLHTYYSGCHMLRVHSSTPTVTHMTNMFMQMTLSHGLYRSLDSCEVSLCWMPLSTPSFMEFVFERMCPQSKLDYESWLTIQETWFKRFVKHGWDWEMGLLVNFCPREFFHFQHIICQLIVNEWARIF